MYQKFFANSPKKIASNKKILKNYNVFLSSDEIIMNDYKLRIVDKQFKRKLERKRAILVKGSKWCSKTTSVEQIAKSVLYISNIGSSEQNINLVNIIPSITTVVLGLGSVYFINDLNTFGLIFENLCIRDIRVYANTLNGKVYHYRDKSGLECDAVINLYNCSFRLIEINLAGDVLIEEGVKSQLPLANKIDTTKIKRPSSLMDLNCFWQICIQKRRWSVWCR